MHHWNTTGIARWLALPIALVMGLGGCASQPSGHFVLALDAQTAGGQSTWDLDNLPRRGRLHFTGIPRNEATRADVSRLVLFFGDPTRKNDTLARLFMEDPDCAGSYGFSLDRQVDAATSQIDYLKPRLPWGQALQIDVQWWPDGRLILDIAGVGHSEVVLPGRVHHVQLRAYKGGLRVDDLQFENLDGK